MPPVTWTRLTYDRWELTNGLESVQWLNEPERSIQVRLCEACGIDHCEPGGWVSAVRLGDLLLWAPVQADDELDPEYRPPPVVESAGAVAIPRREWDRLRATGLPLPSFERFPPAIWEDAAQAWLYEVPPQARPARFGGLRDVVESACAAEGPLGLDEARARCQELVEHCHRAWEEDVDATIVAAEREDIEGVTLYLDSPQQPAWAAFALVGGQASISFGPRWVQCPGSP